MWTEVVKIIWNFNAINHCIHVASENVTVCMTTTMSITSIRVHKRIDLITSTCFPEDLQLRQTQSSTIKHSTIYFRFWPNQFRRFDSISILLNAGVHQGLKCIEMKIIALPVIWYHETITTLEESNRTTRMAGESHFVIQVLCKHGQTDSSVHHTSASYGNKILNQFRKKIWWQATARMCCCF